MSRFKPTAGLEKFPLPILLELADGSDSLAEVDRLTFSAKPFLTTLVVENWTLRVGLEILLLNVTEELEL